jgi:hypothetical protein
MIFFNFLVGIFCDSNHNVTLTLRYVYYFKLCLCCLLGWDILFLFTMACFYFVLCKGPLWSWSYGSWLYNYLCNRCLSPLTLWVRTPLSRGVLDTSPLMLWVQISYIVVVSFIGGGNRSTLRKPRTCHKTLTNFIT